MRRLAVLLAALAVCAIAAPAALAHAALLRSTPADGQVVARAPAQVRLSFDEPVRALGGMRVVRNGGGSVLAGKPRIAGRDLVLPLRPLADGDYTVLYRVLSDDGHVETGVLAFAVGAGRRAPTASLSAAGTLTTRDLVSRFLVFAGLLLVAGTALFRLLVWRAVAAAKERPPHELALLLAGFVAIFLGGSGLTGHGLPFTRFGIAYGALIALAVCGAVATAISAADPPVRALALGIALALVPLPSIAGHALEDGRLRAPELLLDVVHLLAASVWLGGVASLLLALGARKRELRQRLARRFSVVALDAVVLLAITGVVRAIGELRAFHQLWTTSYGVAILVKSGLFVALVCIGALNRRRLIPAGAGGGLRLALRLELLLLTAAVGAVAFLTDARPGRTILPPLAPPPPPLALPRPGAVVFATHQRDVALGFALTKAGADTQLTLSAIGPLGQGVVGLDPTLRIGSRRLPLDACGGGCYRTLATLRGGERADLVLRRRDGKTTHTAVTLPSPDAPSASALVAETARRYDALRSLLIDERLSSGRAAVHTHYQVVAPASFAYRILPAGPQAVVLRNRRWDRPSAGARWQETPQTPLPQPRIWWGTRPIDARLVGHDRLRGRSVDVVTLFAPQLKAWFEVWIDPQRKLPLALRMTTTAHFMRHDYSGFDSRIVLRPPR